MSLPYNSLYWIDAWHAYVNTLSNVNWDNFNDKFWANPTLINGDRDESEDQSCPKIPAGNIITIADEILVMVIVI